MYVGVEVDVPEEAVEEAECGVDLQSSVVFDVIITYTDTPITKRPDTIEYSPIQRTAYIINEHSLVTSCRLWFIHL